MATGKFGDWDTARRTLETMATRASDAAQKAVLQEGHFFRGKMVQGIADQAPGGQAFKPLSPITLALREIDGFKGTKALIRHGDLRNGITVVNKHSFVFIGVPKAATAKDGHKLIDIAAIQEFGTRKFVVPVFAKLRQAFEKIVYGPMPAFIAVQIPPRPFIGPVFAKFGATEDVKKRLEERMTKMLKGYLAR